MRNIWRNWIELTRRERLTFLLAFFLLPLAGLVLRFGRYQSVIAALGKMAPINKRGAGNDPMNKALRMAELVNAAAARTPYDGTCLRRSLVLWWLLRWRGIDSQLRIGAQLDGDTFLSHAWVEYKNTVLNDLPDVQTRYVTML